MSKTGWMGCLLELGLLHSRALRHLSGCLPFSLSLSLVSFVFYIVYLSLHCRYIVQVSVSLSLWKFSKQNIIPKLTFSESLPIFFCFLIFYSFNILSNSFFSVSMSNREGGLPLLLCPPLLVSLSLFSCFVLFIMFQFVLLFSIILFVEVSWSLVFPPPPLLSEECLTRGLSSSPLSITRIMRQVTAGDACKEPWPWYVQFR